MVLSALVALAGQDQRFGKPLVGPGHISGHDLQIHLFPIILQFRFDPVGINVVPAQRVHDLQVGLQHVLGDRQATVLIEECREASPDVALFVEASVEFLYVVKSVVGCPQLFHGISPG